MPKPPRLTSRYLATAGPGYHWDPQVAGLALRVGAPRADGRTRRVWVLRYRTAQGHERWLQLGTWPEITVDEARRLARRRAGEVAGGGDPSGDRKAARGEMTFGELAALYMAQHAIPRKKPRSAKMDRINLDKHVLPVWRKRRVTEIRRADVLALHHEIGETKPGAANRVLALVSKVFSFALEREIAGLEVHPARHVKKWPGKKAGYDLSPEEYVRLGQALQEVEGQEIAVAAIQVVALTGARLGEVLDLQWRDIDARRRRAHLRDSKTGEAWLQLGSGALEVIEGLRPAEREPGGWVFRSVRRGMRIQDKTVRDVWAQVRGQLGLPTLRIHDLRHSAATLAARRGQSMSAIQGLLRHTTPAMSARYIQRADEAVAEAARLVDQEVGDLMAGKGKVQLLSRSKSR